MEYQGVHTCNQSNREKKKIRHKDRCESGGGRCEDGDSEQQRPRKEDVSCGEGRTGAGGEWPGGDGAGGGRPRRWRPAAPVLEEGAYGMGGGTRGLERDRSGKKGRDN